MKINSFRWWWVFGNVVWFIAIPIAFAVWLSTEIDSQYKSGLRTTTDGDSLSIPLAIVAVLNGVLLLVANMTLGIVLVIRRFSGKLKSSPDW